LDEYIVIILYIWQLKDLVLQITVTGFLKP
jgi:hypothetical protein